MFAVIEIGGKQYMVREKEVIHTEKVDPQTAKVLLFTDEKNTKVGTPYLDIPLKMTVKKTAKADKVISFKMKAKKRYKRLKGHRQQYNEVVIEKIG